MRHILFLAITILLSGQTAFGQLPTIQLLQSGKSTNLRGLSSRNDKEIWVSGSNGWIGFSQDGGIHWNWHQPAGFANRDFRDIAAISKGAAVIIGIDTPAVILKTVNQGNEWRLVYSNGTPGMFLDAVDFVDTLHGIVLGDPIGLPKDSRPFLARTKDGGNSWQTLAATFNKKIAAGEAFFAASGTNIHLMPNGGFIFPSGGTCANIWIHSGKEQQPGLVTKLPFRQAIPTSGPNGMDIKGKIIALVGGDYTKPGKGDSCFAISYDGGKHWQDQHALPGYGSSVAIIDPRKIIACGLHGVWLTLDGGKHWQTIDKRPYNSLLYIPTTKKLYLAGPKGTIGLIDGL